MKYYLFCIFFCLLLHSFFFSQNNLVIFTESAEAIQIEYQQELYPKRPQSDIKIINIQDNPVKLKIIFSNKNIPALDTSLYLYHPSEPIQNQDVIYCIQKDNKTIKYLASLPSSAVYPIIPEIDTSAQVKTKEEKTIQKIIFLNDTNTICLNPIDQQDFDKVMQHIDQIRNEDRKIVLIEQFIKHNCFNQTQAQIVIEKVTFEVERLKIMKQILSKLTDVFDLWHWETLLKSLVAKESYTEYYHKHLNNLQNNKSLNDSIFQSVIQNLSLINEDISILKEIKIILSHYCVQLNQLEQFINLLNHDQYREEVLKHAYYTLKNKNDFEKAIHFVHFKETKERLKIFYDKQKQK